MRKPFAVPGVLAALLLLGSALAQQPPAPSAPAASPFKTQKQKISYALGMNLGDNLRRRSVDVDPEVLLQGLKAALAGGPALLTEDEAHAALIELSAEIQAKAEAQKQVAAEANKKAGNEFLAANKAKPGVVTLPSGLQYKVEAPGTGPKPAATDTVVCNYRGILLDGTEFDSSYKRGEPITIGVSDVIKGWQEALQLMPVGSKWQLFIPPSLAYGDKGAGDVIGPNATLIFEVELVSIAPKK